MTIDKHCDRNDQDGVFPASQAEAHALMALEQSALHAARLAIARWINNSSEAEAARAPDAAAARTSWYFEAQQNFQEWLGRGGFAQYDIACAEQFAPLMADCSELAADPVAANPATDSGTSTANSCVEQPDGACPERR